MKAAVDMEASSIGVKMVAGADIYKTSGGYNDLKNLLSNDGDAKETIIDLLKGILQKDSTIYVDGYPIAKILSPHSDRISGSNMKLVERGLIT